MAPVTICEHTKKHSLLQILTTVAFAAYNNPYNTSTQKIGEKESVFEVISGFIVRTYLKIKNKEMKTQSQYPTKLNILEHFQISNIKN